MNGFGNKMSVTCRVSHAFGGMVEVCDWGVLCGWRFSVYVAGVR